VVRNVTSSISSSNDLLPVIAVSIPTGSIEIMAAYRTGSGLKSKKSISTSGATWLGEKTIISNTGARNPSLVYKYNDELVDANFNVSWDDGSNVYHQSSIQGNWNSSNNLSTNITSINHQYSSYNFALCTDHRAVRWVEQRNMVKKIMSITAALFIPTAPAPN